MSRCKKHEEYKDSEVEWIGKIPSHWKVVKIKNITRVKRGASPRPIDNPIYFDDVGEYSWVRISDVTTSGMYLYESTEKLSDLGASLSVKLNPGQLLVSICATVGKPCITKIKCCIHDGFVYFPDFKGVNRFLYYIFEAGEAYKGLGKLGTQLNLNTDTVGGIAIGLPPINEQNVIANFLDNKTFIIDDMIANKEKLILLLEEKKQAVISEAVTKGINPDARMKDSEIDWIGDIPEHWRLSKIKYESLINNKTLNEYADDDFEINYIDISSVTSIGEIEGVQRLFFKDAPSRARRVLTKGDTIVSTVRTYLKAIAFTENIQSNLICSTGFAVLTPQPKVVPKYLFYLIRSERYVNEIVRRSVGVSYPAVNASDIGDLECVLPNKNEQTRIVEYLDKCTNQINELVVDIEKQILKLKEYRQSLITEVVTGKIKV